MRALPFGASRSVYSFLRVAHSLWWLGCVALKLPWTNFFDDVITLARSEESVSVDVVTRQFFRLLGWGVSEGEKDFPFSEKFKALGIEVDLSAWSSGIARFANTSKRTAELVSTIKTVLESRTFASPSCPSSARPHAVCSCAALGPGFQALSQRSYCPCLFR